MEENTVETKDVLTKIKDETEKVLNQIAENGLQADNVELLYKLIDIHKDVANEEYWKGKEEYMRYRGYENDSYGRRGVKGTGRYSRYRGEESYGRRGVAGTGRRYRGHDMLEDMHEHYGNYSESKEMAERGHYGAEDESTESLECMLESLVDFIRTLKDDADSQEEVKLIEKYSRKISEM